MAFPISAFQEQTSVIALPTLLVIVMILLTIYAHGRLSEVEITKLTLKSLKKLQKTKVRIVAGLCALSGLIFATAALAILTFVFYF